MKIEKAKRIATKKEVILDEKKMDKVSDTQQVQTQS